jgi:hypothetical protein
MHTNALTTLLFKLDTILGKPETIPTFFEWRDTERAAGNQVRESRFVDVETAQRMCASITLVLAYFERTTWNQTITSNLHTVWENIDKDGVLDAFALLTFLEALRNLRSDCQQLDEPQYSKESTQANLQLRTLISQTQELLLEVAPENASP